MPIRSLRSVSRVAVQGVVFGVAIVTLGVGVLTWRHLRDPQASRPQVCEPEAAGPFERVQMYVTVFPLAENVISEGGRWQSGRKAGLDWSDVRTTNGLAFGVESGTDRGAAAYNDATALVSGDWPADQSAEAAVHSINQDDRRYEEVELRLRSTVTPHCATGYEINFRCSKTANAYAEIVRWNGPLGEFTYLKRGEGARFGVADGDVVKATIVGDVITAYINGTQVLQATDHAYTRGNPGIGFYLRGTKGSDGECGFTRFAASSMRE